MAIKIKYNDPKFTDFGQNDLVINITNGTLFYKSNKSIFKLQGDNLNTTTDVINLGNSAISASKGFFSTPGLGALQIETGQGQYKFKVGAQPTIEVGGHLLPKQTPAPIYDLGSFETPWRDLWISQDSMHFIKTDNGVGASKVGSTFIVGSYQFESLEEQETFTKDNVSDLKAGKSIVSLEKNILPTGNIESVKSITNYIRPEVIFHPTNDESAIIHKTAGRIQYRSPGGDPLDIFCDGESNDTIRLGSTTTNATIIKLHGSISASIDGGSW